MDIQEAIEWQKAFKKTYKVMPKEVDEACNMAIEALEKKRREKVTDEKTRKCIGYYQCPSCGGLLTTNQGFCEYCGQALDWSDFR